MKKRIIALLAVFVLLATLLPAGALAAGTEKKLVAITFDDGPSSHTAGLLDSLKQRGAHATFFMTGSNGNTAGIVHQKAVLTRMWQEGHQLANHTYSHNTKLSKTSKANIQSEVNSVSELIYQASGGAYNDMVRTPGGATGGNLKSSVPAPIILWSVDTLDWKYRNEDTVYQNIISNVQDGSIILLHDLYPTSIAGALRAIDTLQPQGYEFVTVAELMRRRGVTPTDGAVYTRVAKSGTDLPAYSAPVISYSYDSAAGAMMVYATLKEGNVPVYYTTDGSMPTLSSKRVNGAVALTKTSTLTFCGIDSYGTRTPLVTKTIEANFTAVPTAESSGSTVRLRSETAGARIYYTTDGSTPTTSSSVYSAPISAAPVIKAFAAKDGTRASRVVTLNKTAYGDYFTDIDSDSWCYDGVGKIVHQGIMSGTAPNYFEPDSSINRAAAITILYRLAGSPEIEAEALYQDVPADLWCAKAITWAAKAGIADTSMKSFNPSGSVSRELFALLLYRYSQYAGSTLPAGDLPAQFTDRKQVSESCRYALGWCLQNGIVTGTSETTLSPSSHLSRAQAAVLLLRLQQALEDRWSLL